MKLYHGAGYCQAPDGRPVVFPCLSVALDRAQAEAGMLEAGLGDYPAEQGYSAHQVVAAEIVPAVLPLLADEWARA